MKTAFFTVVYPRVEPFFNDFLSSLEKQTCKDFELVCINDGFGKIRDSLRQTGFPCRIVDASGNIQEVRQQGLECLVKQNYSDVIFGDADDCFMENRVELLINKLKECPVVVNDFTTISQNGGEIIPHYLSGRLLRNQRLGLRDILTGNVFGFSNTAVKCDLLRDIVVRNASKAVDWYLFSLIFLKGAFALFTDETITYYRQHGNNIAGIGGAMDAARIRRENDVRMEHFLALSPIDKKFDKSCLQARRLAEVRDDEIIENIWGKVNTKQRYFWWEPAGLVGEVL